MLIVQKFGGSSLADSQRLRHVARMCLERRQMEQDLVVVVSAMGDTTDILNSKARELSGRPPLREMDALMTTGEQQCAALLVMSMQELGLKAVSLTGWQAGILTDCSYGNGDIKLIAPGRIEEELSLGHIPVVTGFQGICTKGDITSLGRGGSDTTAVALAAALEADACEIFTDVDGIYTADPRLLPEAKKLEAIDFGDMLALAKAGSKVLHPKSVELAMASGVELELLSSFSGKKGTRLRQLKDSQRPDFAGITGQAETGRISIGGKKADAGALSRAVMRLAELGIRVLSGSLSENCISIETEKESFMPAIELLHREMILGQ